jgi:hypothetical protein
MALSGHPLLSLCPFLDRTERCILSKAAATRGHAEDRVLFERQPACHRQALHP